MHIYYHSKTTNVDLNPSRHRCLDNGIPIATIPLNKLDPDVRGMSSVDSQSDVVIPQAYELEDPDQMPTEDGLVIAEKVLFIDKIIYGIRVVILKHQKILKTITYSILLLLFLAYVAYSLSFRFGDEGSLRLTLYFVVLTLIAVYIGLAVIQTRPRNLVSLGGIFVFIFILFLMSNNKANINWHTVFWGLSLEFGFALIILRTEWGIGAVNWTTDRFLEFIAFSDTGSAFIFSKRYKEFNLIFKVVPSVIVFCSAIAVLSYLGVLAFIISNLGGFLGYCLQTNPVESMNAATNIFMSGIESLMVISEYIDSLSTSHIFCIYTNGLSSIAGSALVLFSNFGVPVEYLLTASVMSAPAALVASKMVYPSETGKDDTKICVVGTKSGTKSLMQALSLGGMQGLQLMVNVLVNLLIYISLFAFVNASITWFGDRAGVEELTLQKIFSYCLWPLAFIMGIDAIDCLKVAEMLGVRMFATVALGYLQMGTYFTNKEKYNEYNEIYNNTDRSELITTYAMCGFASMPSVGITLGSFAVLAPGRVGELSKLAMRGLIAGTIASYLTACVAGLLFA
ncbi:Sodium/nucleoside cotransporter 1 [Mizuhopecten yessoensis]|uniref:Sodium/nucleoside cotransporter 1 n=1 Tax=Mizuhopecten yessoensis TaxID=6573 RepID=A0A210QSM7_MIZYE|nr:Sodium/nucleoside cotransporter 1 [Mizuhopecten yessoensis]